MTNSIDFILTTAASDLMSKTISGKTLNFTRMAVGDGFSYDITLAKDYKALVNEVLNLDITKKETLSPSSVRITAAFKNTDSQKEFYYREVGLYAQDPDTGEEVLYAYGNRNDAAELITPAGSNVVTKQLVFIIAVGDSANVTFNVNADVYALQSDMLDVQENKADKNLANTGMITNCLLEVPQRIKYVLSYGVLTVKKGSVLIVPYGIVDLTSEFPIGSNFLNTDYKVVDRQYKDNNFFVWVEITEDLTVTETTTETNVERWVFFSFDNKSLTVQRNVESNTTGNSSDTSGLLCYRTDLNKVHLYTGHTVLIQTCSLPILRVRSKDSYTYGDVIQVFNGFGYIGLTVWADKGIKGLIPNGIDFNGNVNSVFYKSSNINFFHHTVDGIRPVIIGPDYGINLDYQSYIDSEKMPLTTWTLWYKRSENIIFASFDTIGVFPKILEPSIFCGTASIKSGIIESLYIKQPLQIVDYNDYIDRIEKLESRISVLETKEEY